MSIWNKLTFGIFKKDEPTPLFYKKIVAIRGELTPNLLYLDLGTFTTEDDKPTADPGEHVSLEISQKLRATVNRILAGQETPEDINVLELAIKKLL